MWPKPIRGVLDRVLPVCSDRAECQRACVCDTCGASGPGLTQRVDAGFIAVGTVVFATTGVLAVAELARRPLLPTVLRYWPALLAAAALLYAASSCYFIGRAVRTTACPVVCVPMVTVALAKLVHALVYTSATVAFMVGLPIASVSDLFSRGEFKSKAEVDSDRRTDLDTAVAVATTVWAVVAVTSWLGFVASALFMVRMRRQWAFLPNAYR